LFNTDAQTRANTIGDKLRLKASCQGDFRR
jgi:hypothetical protein